MNKDYEMITHEYDVIVVGAGLRRFKSNSWNGNRRS